MIKNWSWPLPGNGAALWGQKRTRQPPKPQRRGGHGDDDERKLTRTFGHRRWTKAEFGQGPNDGREDQRTAKRVVDRSPESQRLRVMRREDERRRSGDAESAEVGAESSATFAYPRYPHGIPLSNSALTQP